MSSFKEHKCSLKTDEMKEVSEFREWFLIYRKNPLCRIYFQSNSEVQYERERHIHSGFWYIIHPYSKFRMYYDNFMVVLFVISMITIPFDVGFNPLPREKNRCIYHICPILNTILCFFYMADIMVSCFTGYACYSTKRTVLNQWKILLHYLKSYFIFDLLSSIPVDLVDTFVFPDTVIVVKFGLNFLYLFRLVRIRTIYKHVDRVKRNHGTTFRLLKVFSIYVIGVHWAACIKFICYKCLIMWSKQERRNWVSLMLKKMDISNGFYSASQRLEVWTISFFNAVKFLLFDVSESSNLTTAIEDIVIAFILRAFAMFYLSFQGASLIHILIASDATSRKYLEKMNQLQEYMRNKEFPMYLQDRLILYYEYRYQKKYFREYITKNPITGRMQQEIARYSSYQLIKSIKILSGLSEQVIDKIIDSVRPEVYLPGDILMKAGNTAECMYFLVHGTVATYTINGKEVCHYEDGDYFGIVAVMLPERKRMSTAVALEISKLFRFDKKLFNICFPVNSEIYETLLHNALVRLKQILTAEEKQRLYIIESANKQ